jgi:hypothetical protein
MVFTTTVTDRERRTKRCPRCGEVRSFEAFGFSPHRRGGGIRSICRTCHNRLQRERYAAAGEEGRKLAREAHRKWVAKNRSRRREYERRRGWRRHFGLSIEQFEQLVRKQGGGCAICAGKPPSGSVLCVDHDHATGEIRGLLCGPCNIGLARFKDDPVLLKRAVSYLRRPRSVSPR